MSNLEVQNIYPLSPMQEGMLFHWMMDRNSNAYFEQLTFSMEGGFDLEVFEKSLNTLVQRHDIFRTIFVVKNVKKPQQVVLKERPVKVQFLDISMKDEEEKDTFIENYRKEERIKGFDLTRDILLRPMVFKTGEKSYFFILNHHHILMDGWCLNVFLNELFQAYSNLISGKLPEMERVYPYSNYIKWLVRQDREEGCLYWKEYLKGYEQKTLLPKLKSKTVSDQYHLMGIEIVIDEVKTSKIMNITKNMQVTPSTVIQTIWGILLQKYANSEDVVFGSVVSGRPSGVEGVEKILGIFINTIPLRITTDSKTKFSRLVKDVQNSLISSEKYSYISLSDIQSAADIGKDLIEHFIVYENYPVGKELDSLFEEENPLGFTIKEFGNPGTQNSFNFGVTVIPWKEIHMAFGFNSNVYDIRLIEAIEGHINKIVDQITGNIDIEIGSIEILTEKEKELVLNKFNATKLEYPSQKTFNQLFEEQVEKTPDNIAVVFEDKKLTYTELNRKSNSLARVLRDYGAKPGSIIAVMVERSLDVTVGILGVMKAGGAYLPIDPLYPTDRIKHMLDDSKASIILTHKSILKDVAFKFLEEIQLTSIDLEDCNIDSHETSNLSVINTPEDIAYLIYTSGTTGKPKGVMVEHKSLVNISYAWKREYRLEDMDVRLLQIASFSFDVFAGDISRALLNGGRMVICSSEERYDPALLYLLIKRHQITIFESTPALILPLMDYIYDNTLDIDSIQLLILGSDTLSVEDFEKLHSRYGEKIRIINSYGVTEATIDSSYYEKRFGDFPESGSVPIGKPLQNIKYYVLDKNLNAQPIGVFGELYIGGDGVARGYLDKPELSSQRFIDNPFIKGEKVYLTGDVVRWMSEGNIQFAGRADNQVKIRGFRIELGEIESQLLKCPDVKEAIIEAKDDSEGNKNLCAFIVADVKVDINGLKENLYKELPDYMIPSYFVQLENLPLTPNGKIDRKALPGIDQQLITAGKYAAPSNEIEVRLVQVWQEVLGVEKIGVNDDFFTIGGNSLKTIQVVAKLAVDFAIKINDIFKYRTVKNLASNIIYEKGSLKKKLDHVKEMFSQTTEEINLSIEIQKEIKAYNERIKKYNEINLSEQKKYGHILLTGATGYLGIHLLHDLLKTTDSKIYLLIRGNDQNEAEKRLEEKFSFYFDHHQIKEYKERIMVLNGDLSEDCFGLAAEVYSNLTNTIDCVMNSAANVRHYGNYDDFYRVNVKGPEQLLKFCRSNKLKDVNHISTLSVAFGNIKAKNDVLFTEYECDMGQEIDNYYVKTKLEGEKLMMKAREEGLNVNVYRVGNLTFNSQSGKFQTNMEESAFYKRLRALIKLGTSPAIDLEIIDFSFIDYTSRIISMLFDKKNLQNETYHIRNPKGVSQSRLSSLINDGGFCLRVAPFGEFLDYLYENYDNNSLKVYIEDYFVHSGMFDTGGKTNYFTFCDKTDLILKRLGIDWPELNQDHVRKMIEHCTQMNFL